MVNPEGSGIPEILKRSRHVPKGYYEQEIRELKRMIKTLENKVDNLQELVDQYQWVLGVGEENA